MSTNLASAGAAEMLFGKVRSAVLALLFAHAERACYFRQIVRETGLGHGAVQRELGLLLKLGLVTRTRQGREVFYQANRVSPLFPELRRLMLKTAGLADVLRDVLHPLAERVHVAFMYGSLARGVERPESDVDLMVIGNVDFGELISALGPAQGQVGREINPSLFSPEEWARRVAEHEHFVTAVLAAEKVFLIGEAHDLTGLG